MTEEQEADFLDMLELLVEVVLEETDSFTLSEVGKRGWQDGHVAAIREALRPVLLEAVRKSK